MELENVLGGAVSPGPFHLPPKQAPPGYSRLQPQLRSQRSEGRAARVHCASSPAVVNGAGSGVPRTFVGALPGPAPEGLC